MGQASFLEDITDRLQDAYGDMLTLQKELCNETSSNNFTSETTIKLIDKADQILKSLQRYKIIADDPK